MRMKIKQGDLIPWFLYLPEISPPRSPSLPPHSPIQALCPAYRAEGTENKSKKQEVHRTRRIERESGRVTSSLYGAACVKERVV